MRGNEIPIPPCVVDDSNLETMMYSVGHGHQLRECDDEEIPWMARTEAGEWSDETLMNFSFASIEFCADADGIKSFEMALVKM